MQWTDNRAARHDAIRQRPGLVWAAVINGKVSIAKIEDSDHTITHVHSAAFAERDVTATGNLNP
jgi:hypothetical protein